MSGGGGGYISKHKVLVLQCIARFRTKKELHFEANF